MKKIVLNLIIIFCSLVCTTLAAADVGVFLSLDRTEATPADTVRLEVTVSGSRKSDTQPVIQGLDSFHFSRGGTSSQVEIINGKVSSKITYTYFLQPRKAGNYQIGPAKIRINGRTKQSNQVNLSVKEAIESSDADRDPIFIEATISSHETYIEEQLLYTIKLYRRVRVDDLSLQLPEVDHLSFKQLGRPRQYQTTLDGKSYQVLEIRHALWATKPGTFIVAPSRLNMTVLKPGSQNAFDSFFDNSFFRKPFSTLASGRPLTLATPSLELKVSPLPQNGRPADFSGLVGEFQMTSTLTPEALKVGESATLTVRISGIGDVNRIPDINMPELSFARIYDDQPVLETTPDDQGFGGTKTMKWAIVPEQAGSFKLPALVLSFFSPDSGAYDVMQSAEHTLNVLPAEQKRPNTRPSPVSTISPKPKAKQAIKNIGEDILPIHTSAGNLSPPFQKWFSGWRLWVALFGPLAVYLVLTGALVLRQQSPHRLAQNKEKKALRAFVRRCRRGYATHNELIESFRDYLNDRFGMSLGALTVDDIDTVLRSKGINPDVIDNARALIQRIEQTVYSGEIKNPADTTGDLERLVRRLDKETR